MLFRINYISVPFWIKQLNTKQIMIKLCLIFSKNILIKFGMLFLQILQINFVEFFRTLHRLETS
jgi:hypothetical protein